MNIDNAGRHRGDHDDADAERGSVRSWMISTKTWLVLLLVFASVSALAADARERGFIRKGMGEGEVVLRIGKPDHEAFIRVVKGEPEEKTWSYFPHARDPQTLTIVTLHAGVVTRVDRKIWR
jgi:hypothetical protein